jgi:formate dehydrogenase iron-sulfur subunit
MARMAILLDTDRCVGCEACVVACHAGRELAAGQMYSQVREVVFGRLPDLRGAFVHQRCFHCAEAACVAVCPTGALRKQDGLTAVDADLCSGCGYCVDACPYGVPRLVGGIVSKCTGCLDLVQEGKEPWCVQTCPSDALQIGPRDELLAEARRRVAALKGRHPDAQVYGEEQLGGLGLLLVLTEKPAVLGLLDNPTIPVELRLWQDAAQPATLGLTGAALAASGLAFIIARRAHRQELRERAARRKPTLDSSSTEAAPERVTARPPANAPPTAGPQASESAASATIGPIGAEEQRDTSRSEAATGPEQTGGE